MQKRMIYMVKFQRLLSKEMNLDCHPSKPDKFYGH